MFSDIAQRRLDARGARNDWQLSTFPLQPEAEAPLVDREVSVTPAVEALHAAAHITPDDRRLGPFRRCGPYHRHEVTFFRCVAQWQIGGRDWHSEGRISGLGVLR